MLLSSSYRKYQPYPLSYFSVAVCLRCLLHHILSLIAYTFRKTVILFSILLCSLWWVQIIGYVVACRSYSFVCALHHLIIIIVQTYLKTLPVRYILSTVWLRLSIFSPLSIKQYMGLHDFSLPIPLVMIERMYTYHHNQIGSMSYYPLFMIRSWNNGMHCMSLYSYRLTHPTIIWLF